MSRNAETGLLWSLGARGRHQDSYWAKLVNFVGVRAQACSISTYCATWTAGKVDS